MTNPPPPYRAVILCGGSGSRLWPLSRELLPKQFIRLTDDRSLLQNTLLRLASAGAEARPTLVCNDAHRYIAAEQALELGIKDAEVILEPFARNTAPAIAAATLRAAIADDDKVAGRLALFGRRMMGEALSQAQRVAADRDAITGLLVDDGSGTGADLAELTRLFARITGNHTARMEALGLQA